MAKRTERIVSGAELPGKGDMLISRFSALGDVAMTLPPVYDACLSNPDRRFIFLTRPHPASMFINPPGNLILHPVDTGAYRGIGGMWKLFRELRSAYDISAYADLHDVLRTRLLRLFFRLEGVRTAKVDKGRARRRRLTRKRRKMLVELPPMGRRYAETLSEAGAPCKGLFRSIFPALPPSASPESGMPEKLPGEFRVAIAPFARHAGKIYPADLMEKAIELILRNESASKIFLFGFGPEEEREIEEWRESIDARNPGYGSRIINMASKRIGLPSELALIAGCDVMLSMDSANMHLASLAGTRVVSIWGATHPFCGFRPANVRDEDILQLDMVCRPCSVFGNRKCRFEDYHCLRGISPARVAERVLNAGGFFCKK